LSEYHAVEKRVLAKVAAGRVTRSQIRSNNGWSFGGLAVSEVPGSSRATRELRWHLADGQRCTSRSPDNDRVRVGEKGRDLARMRSAPWAADVTWSIPTKGGCATEKCGAARFADVSLAAALPKPVRGHLNPGLARGRVPA
jgi:hypothetical protein